MEKKDIKNIEFPKIAFRGCLEKISIVGKYVEN